MSRAEAVEEVQFLTSQGQTPDAIVQALNTTHEALARRLHRAGHTALARPYWATAKRRRTA